MSVVEQVTKSDGYQERAISKPSRYSKTTKGGRILKYGVAVVVGDVIARKIGFESMSIFWSGRARSYISSQTAFTGTKTRDLQLSQFLAGFNSYKAPPKLFVSPGRHHASPTSGWARLLTHVLDIKVHLAIDQCKALREAGC